MSSAEGNGSESPSEIRSLAPVRINDIGGWTDTWFSGHGRVLNLAAAPGVETRIRISSNPALEKRRVHIQVCDFNESFSMDPDAPDYSTHPLLQAAVAIADVPRNVQLKISLHSSVPAGISVGTSAAVCTSLLGGLLHLLSSPMSAEEVAVLAHRAETEKLGWQSGIQDQICAALGGVCFIDMPEYPHALIQILQVPPLIYAELDKRLCLVYLGAAHNSSDLHLSVIRSLEVQASQSPALERMRELPLEAKQYLLAGDFKAYGTVMSENTECQRALHPMLVGQEADAVIRVSKKHAAAGCKVNGAGGRGGSLTILGNPDPQKREDMLQEIHAMGHGIRVLPLSLSQSGLVVKT